MPESGRPNMNDEPEGPDLRVLMGVGTFLFLAGAVFGAAVYSLGIARRTFDLSMLRGGLLTFGIVTLLCVAGVVVMTIFIQILGVLWPRSLTIWSEHRLLRRARNKTLALLQRRHRMQEERARLTARLQATYLLEKESATMANQKALQELRSALQVSAVRSCEIVMDHLNQTLEQYQQLVDEIESSSLDAVAKKELLDLLQAKLNTDAADQKRQSAQMMMETAIWDVRLEKARRIARRSLSSAVAYLEKLRKKTESHRVLLKIDALLKDLQNAEETPAEAG
jgi:hypothetical protein